MKGKKILALILAGGMLGASAMMSVSAATFTYPDIKTDSTTITGTATESVTVTIPDALTLEYGTTGDAPTFTSTANLGPTLKGIAAGDLTVTMSSTNSWALKDANDTGSAGVGYQLVPNSDGTGTQVTSLDFLTSEIATGTQKDAYFKQTGTITKAGSYADTLTYAVAAKS